MQSLLRMIYPAQCLTCPSTTESDAGFCGSCRREADFIEGLVCDACGAPVPGEADGSAVLCDDCLVVARPWTAGRAALVYKGTGRRLVLMLKHGDRTEVAGPAAGWMLRAAGPLLQEDMLVVPVPLHRFRFLKRRYNQAALLAAQLARQSGLGYCPDLLVRTRATKPLDGIGRDSRFARLEGAITPHPRRGAALSGRDVLIVDDVMTSGATFAAASEACFSAGAKSVRVLALARVVKDA